MSRSLHVWAQWLCPMLCSLLPLYTKVSSVLMFYLASADMFQCVFNPQEWSRNVFLWSSILIQGFGFGMQLSMTAFKRNVLYSMITMPPQRSPFHTGQKTTDFCMQCGETAATVDVPAQTASLWTSHLGEHAKLHIYVGTNIHTSYQCFSSWGAKIVFTTHFSDAFVTSPVLWRQTWRTRSSAGDRMCSHCRSGQSPTHSFCCEKEMSDSLCSMYRHKCVYAHLLYILQFLRGFVSKTWRHGRNLKRGWKIEAHKLMCQ